MLTASLRLRLQFRCDDVIRCSDKDRQKIAEIMFETYNVQALCIKPQPLLAMYSYGATTGVVVDIGNGSTSSHWILATCLKRGFPSFGTRGRFLPHLPHLPHSLRFFCFI